METTKDQIVKALIEQRASIIEKLGGTFMIDDRCRIALQDALHSTDETLIRLADGGYLSEKIAALDSVINNPVKPVVKKQLRDHFNNMQCHWIEKSLGVTTVEDLQSMTDEQILSVKGIGKLFLHNLRKL